MLGMAYVHYIRCNNCSRYDMYLGSITVAAAHELEYEAQSGMQTRFVRSMIRVFSWDSVPLSINTIQMVITSTLFESVLGYIES